MIFIRRLLLLAAIACVGLTSCTTPVKINLDHSRFSKGYLNSSLLPEGALLIWDLKAANPRHSIVSTATPDTSNNKKLAGVCGIEITECAKSDLDFGGGVSAHAVTAEASAEFHKLTNVTIQKFCSSRFEDAGFVLNEPDFAEQRKILGPEYADKDQYRFIFITGATLADDVAIHLGSPDEAGNSVTLAVGGKKFELSLANSSSSQWTGSSTPVFIRPTLFKLISDPSGASGYRFVVDTDTRYNFTAIVRDADI